MITFLLTQFLVALFGLPVILHPTLRRESLALRLVAMFVAGSVILTVEALLLSYLGMSWGERTLPLPVIVATAFAAWKWRATERAPKLGTLSGPVPVVAVVAIIIAAAWLIHATHVTRAAVSYENIGVVGAKASRMAEGRGAMLEWRALETTAVLRPADPPLPEIVRAWSEVVLGREVWKEAPAASTFWFLLTMVAVVTLFAPRLGERESWLVVAFWAIASSLALVAAQGMGGAESFFVCFTTIAAVAIQRVDSAGARAIAFWSLAAMALTRPEGIVFALAIAATSKISPLRLMATPVVAAALWFIPAAIAGVLLPLRPEFRFASPDAFMAGSYGIAFVLPLWLIAFKRRPPALALVALLIVVTVPAVSAQMTLPRYSLPQPYEARAVLPLVGVVIVAGAMASFDRVRRSRDARRG